MEWIHNKVEKMEAHRQSTKSQNAVSESQSDVLKSQKEFFDNICKTLENEEKLLHPDLTQIIGAIDEFLLRQKENTDTKKEKFRENKHFKILDKCGNTIKLVGDEVSNFCKKNIKVGIEVLEIVGESNWATVGLVLVASVLEKMETEENNKIECVKLLKSMNDLAKIVLELQPLPHETVTTQAKMKEAIHTIIHGAITCVKVLQAKGIFHSGDHEKELEGIRRETEELRSVLHAHISVCIFKWLCDNRKECRGTKQNEEVLDEKPAGNDTSTVADQTPRDISRKRNRDQDSGVSSDLPDTPSKREKV